MFFRVHDDPYVNGILERPSSAEWVGKSQRKSKKQLQEVDTSRLVDPATIMPFSNYISGAEVRTLTRDFRTLLISEERTVLDGFLVKWVATLTLFGYNVSVF